MDTKDKDKIDNNQDEIVKIIPKPTIPIAPDGYIPNSIIMRVIHEWRKKHPNFSFDYLNNKSYGSVYNLLKEFDKKINDINNIEIENELIREIVETFRESVNSKKQEEMEKKKQNNIKLHTEFSSFMMPQSSFQQNRFLNKYFNGTMPSIDKNIKEKEEEEEERKKKEEEEKKAKKAAEEANKSKLSSNLNKDSTNTITMPNKNLTRTSTIIGNSVTRTNTSMGGNTTNNSSNKFLAIKYLNDEIDIKEKTIEVINENLEDSSSENDDNSELEEDEDKGDKEEEEDEEEEDEEEEEENGEEDGNDDEMDVDNENVDEEKNKEDHHKKENKDEGDKSNKDNVNNTNEENISEKRYLYYSEDDIPEEVKKLLESFWFPKYLVNTIH